MGIPHLISTLEPYATHAILQDESVVIDGPALAYHILHACRANGILQPSYSLLGRSAIEWLDNKSAHRVAVQAIYFDGYLPPGKRQVRMGRVMKSTSQLNMASTSHPRGCPKKHAALVKDTVVDFFKTGLPQSRPFVDPSFFVPAIIDALRLCPRYQALVHLVPGEADSYCAKHVAEHGGLVLTSDSDLLAHDLGHGQVVFLRDIRKNAYGDLACATFAPGRICRRLGLSSSADACRLAYERSRSPAASHSQVIRACFQPVADETDFSEFLSQYQHSETVRLPTTPQSNLSILNGLDPRVSELVIQFSQLQESPETATPDIKIFLPILLENPVRGSAWEQSTFIRQLAYTAARGNLSASIPPVQEYRRVQSLDQKGRQVAFLPTTSSVRKLIDDMLELNMSMRQVTSQPEHSWWVLFCLVLDIRECHEQGKHSHALRMLQHPAKSSGGIPWDLIHLAAQLQAMHYSIRILQQVVQSTAPNSHLENTSPNIHRLCETLSDFPPLAEFPDIDNVLDLLQSSNRLRALRILGKFVDVSEEPDKVQVNEAAKISKQRQKQNKNKTKARESGRDAKPAASTSMNKFSLLSIDHQ